MFNFVMAIAIASSSEINLRGKVSCVGESCVAAAKAVKGKAETAVSKTVSVAKKVRIFRGRFR